MTSYLSRLSPVPGFPSYTGPYKVGTLDVELPISQLESPAPAPSDDIPTVQYRIFYPCEPDAKGKHISWIPSPQRGYVSGYTRFLGAGSYLAEFISFFPRLLHYISIPAIKNGTLLEPKTSNDRWPVMIFSHGLGGTRNAYSHLVGSIASHGVIVIAPEHRDGSTPISYIRSVPSEDRGQEKSHSKHGQRTTDYTRLSHTPSPEVEEGRNAQLRIRLWELGLIHDSLLKVDTAALLTNLNTSSHPLSMFQSKMDVHTPGTITFAGHSFGAATTVQLVKSTFYSPLTAEAPTTYKPLFAPSSRSALAQQITPNTPIVLLDCWCMPLRAASTRWLWDKPLPCYSSPTAPGGAAILAVESQAFYKWRVHLKATKRLLSPDPTSDVYDYTTSGFPEPHFYYATSSAHLSQSDFGMLFPWVVKKIFATEEPERVMRLNVRAVLQMMRGRGIEVAKTSALDMEMECGAETGDDKVILGREGVRGWNWLNTDVAELGDVDEDVEMRGEGAGAPAKGKTDPSDAVVGNELMKNREGTAQHL